MATVTTTQVSDVLRIGWTIPESVLELTDTPRAEIQFIDNLTVPAKLDADTNLINIFCNFPVGFVYRVIDLKMWALGPDIEPEMDDFGSAISMSVFPDADSKQLPWSQLIVNTLINSGESDRTVSFQGGGNNTIATFMPKEPVDSPVYARTAIAAVGGVPRLFFSWEDDSSDASDAFAFNWRIRALQYDISQFNRSAVHRPQITISA